MRPPRTLASMDSRRLSTSGKRLCHRCRHELDSQLKCPVHGLRVMTKYGPTAEASIATINDIYMTPEETRHDDACRGCGYVVCSCTVSIDYPLGRISDLKPASEAPQQHIGVDYGYTIPANATVAVLYNTRTGMIEGMTANGVLLKPNEPNGLNSVARGDQDALPSGWKQRACGDYYRVDHNFHHNGTPQRLVSRYIDGSGEWYISGGIGRYSSAVEAMREVDRCWPLAAAESAVPRAHVFAVGDRVMSDCGETFGTLTCVRDDGSCAWRSDDGRPMLSMLRNLRPAPRADELPPGWIHGKYVADNLRWKSEDTRVVVWPTGDGRWHWQNEETIGSGIAVVPPIESTRDHAMALALGWEKRPSGAAKELWSARGCDVYVCEDGTVSAQTERDPLGWFPSIAHAIAAVLEAEKAR